MIWRIRWLLISVQAGGCGLQIGILRYFQCTKSLLACSVRIQMISNFSTSLPPSSYISSFQPWHQLAIMVSRINNIDAALLIEGHVLWEFDNAGLSVCVLFFWFVSLCLCLFFWPVGCVSWHVNCTEVCLTQPASSKMPIRARKYYEQRRCRAFILPKNAWKVNTKALNGT